MIFFFECSLNSQGTLSKSYSYDNLHRSMDAWLRLDECLDTRMVSIGRPSFRCASAGWDDEWLMLVSNMSTINLTLYNASEKGTLTFLKNQVVVGWSCDQSVIWCVFPGHVFVLMTRVYSMWQAIMHFTGDAFYLFVCALQQ